MQSWLLLHSPDQSCVVSRGLLLFPAGGIKPSHTLHSTAVCLPGRTSVTGAHCAVYQSLEGFSSNLNVKVAVRGARSHTELQNGGQWFALHVAELPACSAS